jgi:hypothetical protein
VSSGRSLPLRVYAQRLNRIRVKVFTYDGIALSPFFKVASFNLIGSTSAIGLMPPGRFFFFFATKNRVPLKIRTHKVVE